MSLKTALTNLLALLLLGPSSAFAAPLIPYEIESVGPTSVSPGEVVNLTVIDPLVDENGANNCMLGPQFDHLVTDDLTKTVRLSINVVFLDLGVCPFLKQRVTIPVFLLPNIGSYKVEIFDNSPNFEPERLIYTTMIEVTAPNPANNPEVPAEGSIQSGVGMVRGWACDAKTIEVSFDDGERIPVAYGTSREDTREICGDANNGYGMVVAWGSLGEGLHRMKTYRDGFEISDVEFEVSGLDEPFIKGLSGSYELLDFPAPGESVTVEWSEPHQNFIITEQDN